MEWSPLLFILCVLGICTLSLWTFFGGLRTGQLDRIIYRPIRREHSPSLFWVGMIFQLVVAAITFFMAASILLLLVLKHH